MNRLILAGLCLVTLIPSVASAQFMGMRSRTPKDANTLVLMDVDKMFGSRVADRENWEAKRKAAYDSGLVALPPDASEIMLASRLDLEYGDPVWELMMVRFNGDRNVTSVAARFGGEMDSILERSAARLPNDQYVMQISSNLLASYTPANRQDVSRWLRSTDKTSSVKLSPYLEQAFGYATKVGTPIVMAIDLDGMISPLMLKTRLPFMESLKDSGIPEQQIVSILSSLKGATLGITLRKDTVAAIRVDFGESPAPMAKVGKALLIEILERQGAMIDDIRDWQPAIEGNTFLLRGTFSEGGSRRVMSVLELPRSLSDAMHDAQSAGSDPERVKLLSTKQYYQSVTTLIEDLRKKPKRDGVKTFGQAAIWYDRYARKIDNLPILNVDEDMLEFGTVIASMFREAEGVMKGVGMRTSLRTASNNPVSGGFSTSGGGYRANTGYWGVDFGPGGYTASVGAGRASLQAKSQSDAVIRGQERTAGASSVQQIWQQIDVEMATIRKEMTQKYSTEF